ncbi:YlaH-like family protein [Bacillus sp. DX1.1]|uniref:YlaH-like family protein n=1 Tax=unclassified Bacillus (in: firmicutes) TaxID=185979 RepID=UPI002570815A|nr:MULTISPECIES: YlaH-like family protein [unclassified Bacillus (in: firmicutes)]MDM5156140.1 YlaH-like family protein [Bacillus sp. DX1.1]WJE80424.1 YlaH-like family protein [Bacillus sp. DX3.1]
MAERMSFFAKLCNVDGNPEVGMWLLYGTMIILSAIVYNLGFARKLSILKNVIIYTVLAAGCTILTFFAVFLPVGEGLVVAAIVLGIYKLRLRQAKQQKVS